MTRPKLDTIPVEKLYSLGKNFKNPKYRALFYFQYLIGGRINEIVNRTVKDDIFVYKGRWFVRKHVSKKRETAPFQEKMNEVPVLTELEAEQKMWDYVLEYSDSFDRFDVLFRMRANPRKSESDFLSPKEFEMAKRRIIVATVDKAYWRATLGSYVVIDESTGMKYKTVRGISSHALRHFRLNHLVAQPYNFDEVKLWMFTKWTDMRPAKRYIRRNREFWVNVMG